MKKASGKSNLGIVKDYLEGNRPFVQVGYDANLENDKRKEGEEWEDSQGHKWVWKNKSKRRVSKRATIINEQRCKTCNMDVRWGNYLDDRVWPKTGYCYDCFINFQSFRNIIDINFFIFSWPLKIGSNNQYLQNCET